MLSIRPGKEIVLRIQNEIGILAQLTKVLTEKGLNILAAAAWVEGSTGVIHLVTDDNLRASDALKARDYAPREVEVVMAEVAHKPGMLRHIADRLAEEQIDLHHLYASATTDADRTLVVFASANNDRAIVLLNQ